LRDISFATATETYSNNVLTVSDGVHTAHINFVGSYELANFHFSNDGFGGTLVTDPPVSGTDEGTSTAQNDGNGVTLVVDPPAITEITASTVISPDAEVLASGVDGSIRFADTAPGAVSSVSVTPDHGGIGYVGNFAVEPIAQSNGSNLAEWHFAFDQSQSTQSLPSEVLSQSYELKLSNGQANAVTQEVTLMIGTAHSDTFVLKPGLGTAIVTNFSDEPGVADTFDLERTAVANFAELQALMQPARNGHDTFINLGHGDSITIANILPSQLHAEGFIFNHL
jgi:hypothetical protein